MALTHEEIQKIAQLARIDLSEAELEQYREQLSSVLEYVGQLGEVSAEGLGSDYAVKDLSNVEDTDVAAPVSERTRENLLEAMPDRVGDLLKTKSIFD